MSWQPVLSTLVSEETSTWHTFNSTILTTTLLRRFSSTEIALKNHWPTVLSSSMWLAPQLTPFLTSSTLLFGATFRILPWTPTQYFFHTIHTYTSTRAANKSNIFITIVQFPLTATHPSAMPLTKNLTRLRWASRMLIRKEFMTPHGCCKTTRPVSTLLATLSSGVLLRIRAWHRTALTRLFVQTAKF